jgi:hypothetical protein
MSWRISPRVADSSCTSPWLLNRTDASLELFCFVLATSVNTIKVHRRTDNTSFDFYLEKITCEFTNLHHALSFPSLDDAPINSSWTSIPPSPSWAARSSEALPRARISKPIRSCGSIHVSSERTRTCHCKKHSVRSSTTWSCSPRKIHADSTSSR